MSNLTRTPIVDSNGKPTHVWKSTDEPTGSSRAAAAPVAPPAPAQVDYYGFKSWSDSNREERLVMMQDMAINTMSEHGLFDDDYRDWKFEFKRGRRFLGDCRFGTSTGTIRISKDLAGLDDNEGVEQVILHEVAHALAGPDANHGPVWQAIAKDIGYEHGRAISVNIPEPAPSAARNKVAIWNGKEVPVYVGDTVRAWDGVNVKITKVNRTNFRGIAEDGSSHYDISFRRAEQYKDDYAAVQSQK